MSIDDKKALKEHTSKYHDSHYFKIYLNSQGWTQADNKVEGGGVHANRGWGGTHTDAFTCI